MEFGTAVKIAEIEGRGKALVASQPLRAGQIVLKDAPILLYFALPLIFSSPEEGNRRCCYCSHCFRRIIVQPLENNSVVPCPSCTAPGYSALFCSPSCKSTASFSSHTPWVCQALSRLRDGFSCSSTPPQQQQQLERQVQARFLVAAYNLAVISPPNFRILLSLQGSSPCQPDDSALFLHSLMSVICPPPPLSPAGFCFSLELTAALLAKDKLNAFGLMEPFTEDGERSVRAYGIYPKASLFNHDCLPNACRFDYVDAAAAIVSGEPKNTDIIFRVIHDVPEGREICLSYFPVNLRYSARQRRLREDYGFTCSCDRCKVEANWPEEEEEEEEEKEKEEEEEAKDEDDDEVMEESGEGHFGVEGENDFPHAYFFLRYMCNRKNCWGTLAPLPPSNSTPSIALMECSVCGNLKNDEEEEDDDDDDDDEGAMDGDALDN